MSSHNFRGQITNVRRRDRSGFSQAKTRRPVTMYDQHGRPWSAQLDNKTGMPTGLITPDFQAPWIPDQSFLVVNPENAAELYIDYPAMLRSRAVAMRKYHTRVVEHCERNEHPVPERGRYDDAIIRAFGKPPKPLEPVAGARAENAYLLGFTEVPDMRYVPFIQRPDVVEDIMAEFNLTELTSGDPVAPKAPWDKVAAARARARQLAPLTEEDREAIAAADRLAGGTGTLAEPGDEDEADAMFEGDEGLEKSELLQSVEEESDAEAMGGRTIKPQNAERAARQAPRRETASPVRRRQGAHRSGASRPTLAEAKARQRGARKTLADGAAPVLGDGTD